MSPSRKSPLAAGIGALVAIAEASGDTGPSAIRSADPR